MNTYLLLLVLASAMALNLPGYIKKCSIKDPNFNTCALKSARDAMPNLIKGERKHNIPPLDPLFIKRIRMADGSLESSVFDTTITGIKDIILESISFDFDKKGITVEARVPNLNLDGKYNMSGKLVSLPISGNGNMKMSLYDNYVKFTTGYDLTKLDHGEVYLVLKDNKMVIKPENVTCHLDNLFNGNKLLGDSMNTFINENWKLILEDKGTLLYDAMGNVIHTIFLGAAKTVPYKNIFDDVQ